jgi:hypothetical protein
VRFNKLILMCPNIMGSKEGVRCTVQDDLIRNIDDVSVDICLSRKFESCHIYFAKPLTRNGEQSMQMPAESVK